MARGVAFVVYGLLFVLLMAGFIVSHGGVADEHGETHPEKEDFLSRYWQALLLGTVILLFAVLVFEERIKAPILRHRFEVGTFLVICFVVVAITGYILFDTLEQNILSWSGGPVHWHADLEIVVCGEQRSFDSPESRLLNRVGTPSVHHHDDMRIHLEGVLMTREEATLGNFFDAIGVPFDRDRIFEYRNGDQCPDSSVGKVVLFVNGVENFEYRDYVIAPYPDVPPGDRIKITFG